MGNCSYYVSYRNCKIILDFSNVSCKSTSHTYKEIKQTKSSMQEVNSSQKLQMKPTPEITL